MLVPQQLGAIYATHIDQTTFSGRFEKAFDEFISDKLFKTHDRVSIEEFETFLGHNDLLTATTLRTIYENRWAKLVDLI